MPQLVERRRYRRFEVPGGKAKIGKFAGYSFFKPFSTPYPILNACIGGVNILCNRGFFTGEDLLLELYAPEEKPIKLRAKVIWANPVPISNDLVTGFEFFPFGDDKHLNSPKAMHTLRKLYARYIKD